VKHSIKTISMSLAAISLLLMSTTGLASAHVLKEDNGISAVLHIPPEDTPEANTATELDLSFGDNANAFSLPDCNCKVTVKNGPQVIYQAVPKPALEGATLDSIVNVNFPVIGVYDVIVDGSAKDGKFQPFHLDYLVRVATSATGGETMKTSKGAGSEVVVIGVGSLAILIMLAYNSISIGGRYVKKKPAKAAKPKSK
jgi:hypothetical protein